MFNNSLFSYPVSGAPAIVFNKQNSSIQTLASSLQSAPFVFNSVNSFGFQNSPFNNSSSAVVQKAWAPSSVAFNTPVTGGAASPYNAAASVCNITFTPRSASSTLYCQVGLNYTQGNNGIACEFYINQSGMSINRLNNIGNAGIPGTIQAYMLSGFPLANPGAVATRYDVCVFKGGPTPNVILGIPGDGILITEYNDNLDLLSALPVVITSSSTPVNILVVPTVADQSTFIKGFVYFTDLSVLSSVMATFFLVAQQVGTSTPTIAYNNVVSQTLIAPGTPPYIEFVPQAGGIAVNVVGANGKQFSCQLDISVEQST